MAVSVFAAGAFFLGRWWLESARATYQQLEARLGLVNQNTKGYYPDLRGQIDGVDVVVDTVYQQYARAGSSIRSSLRAWTRIRALLPVSPQVEVRSRHQRLDEKPEWSLRQTGDPAFDQRYEAYMPEDVALDVALPIAVREALMAANPPVHIMKGAASWTRVKIVRDLNLLEHAVFSCVRVAAAFAIVPAVPHEPGF